MASAVNSALVKGALGNKYTLAHYAHTNKQAERAAKELVHEQWFEAAGNDNESTDNVTPLHRKKETPFRNSHLNTNLTFYWDHPQGAFVANKIY
jgi:hypothetical protein